MAWYFDALDARAGRAFATLRPDDLFTSDTLDESGATFFIGPPDFEPEPVASRAVAMSAARHGFQEGLLDEQGEIPFRDLASAAEFVRRVYVRGGGGDGGGGRGEAAPGEGRGPPPDLPLFGGESGEGTEDADMGLDPALRFAAFAWAFQDASESSDRGDYQNVHEEYPKADRSISAAPVARLARGALRTALANLSDHIGHGDIETTGKRAGVVTALGRSIWHAGLIRPIAEIIRSHLKLADWFERRITPSDHLGYDEGIALLLLSGAEFGHHPPHYWPREWAAIVGRTDWNGADPVETLFRLRAPPPYQKQFVAGACKPGQVSIGHLLFSILGSPQLSLANGAPDDDLFEILLFAATIIVQRAMEADLPPIWSNNDGSFVRASLIVRQAERWLRRNIAMKAFSPDLELLIERSAGLATARTRAAERVKAQY